jgi:hypothetical protein
MSLFRLKKVGRCSYLALQFAMRILGMIDIPLRLDVVEPYEQFGVFLKDRLNLLFLPDIKSAL